MQTLGLALLLSTGLLLAAMAVVILPAILSFRPFDYRKVAYRAGVFTVGAMILVILGSALYDEYLSPLRLQSVLEVLALMVVCGLIGALGDTPIVGFYGSFLRRMPCAKPPSPSGSVKRRGQVTTGGPCWTVRANDR